MKTMFLSLLSFALLSSFSVAAETLLEKQPETLSATMKLLGQTLRTIGQQANDPSQNPESEVLALNLVELALHAKTFIPKSISALPVEQQPDALAKYEELLDQVARVSREVAVVFQENRNSDLRPLFAELNRLRKEGHALFDPE